MKILGLKSFSVLVLMIVVSKCAYAGQNDHHHPYPWYPIYHHAPEIDPAVGIGALALLSGSLAVMRGRVKA
jgi:hypothetical protein